MLEDPSLRLLDARPRADYEKGHLPGAVWVDVKALEGLFQSDAVADPAAWARAVAPLGIGAGTEVFAYDDNRQHDAARAWWLLGYAGVEKIGVVDGSYKGWVKAGRPTGTETPAVAAKDFAAKFHPRRVLRRDDIREAAKGHALQLVDARSADEYSGAKAPTNGGRAGHIPGARNLFAYDLVAEDGTILGAEAIREKLAKAGIKADVPVIVYSNGAGRGSVVAFALRRAGVHARVFVPGLNGWSKDDSAQVLKGPIPAGSPSK